MSGHFTIRAARYAAYGLGASVALLLAFALVAPLFLDTPAVERELKAKLSQLVQGDIAWEKLSIRLLPYPRGALNKVTVEISGVARVSADSVDARLRLLPLLHGRAEIASVNLEKPAISLRVGASPPPDNAEPEAGASPMEAYRSLVEAIRRFAPQASLDIEDGETEIEVAGVPPIRVRQLQLHARTDDEGLALELAASSDAWKRLKATANVVFADLSGGAKAEISEVKPQPWLDAFLGRSPVKVVVPGASLSAEARTDGKAKLESRLEIRAGSVEIRRGSERVQVPGVAVAATVSAAGDEVAVRLGRAELGASRLAAGSVRYGMKSGILASTAEFDLDLAQALEATRRLLPDESAKAALARFRPAAGRAQGRASFDWRRSRWNARVDISRSDASIGLEELPGPVRLASGSVRISRDAVRVERADVSLLDARALASATIAYAGPLRIEGTVSEASIGESLLAWVWKTAGAPQRVKLKTPVRVEVQRAAWSPKRPLEVAAAATLESGPSVAVDLAWTPAVLDVRRASIKDAKSDARLVLHLEKGLAQGKFSGSLQSASVGAALKGAKLPSGGASGDLRFRIDLAHPERATATGKLNGSSIDLAWLLGRPVRIERVDVEADGQRLAIREASVNWAEQRFALSGEIARAADGAPIVDAQITSPGVLVDALLPPKDAKAPAPKKEGKAPAGDDALWKQWPLPARGRIALRAGFVQFGERRAEPVVATLTLEKQKANLELKEAQLCGVSFPLTVAATKEGLDIAVRLEAVKQPLEQTARCLTERGVLITGEFDLSAELRTHGRIDDLLPNLQGTVGAQSREGRVMKFALLGNILSMTNVASLLKDGAPRLNEAGFPYRVITAKGRFASGRFFIDESSLRSDAVGLAATGEISLIDYRSRLTVLVAPFERVDRIVRGVPLVGYLVGGLLTSIPVGVSGDIRNPLVVPLGPGAVTSELRGVFERTLTIPGNILPRPAGP